MDILERIESFFHQADLQEANAMGWEAKAKEQPERADYCTKMARRAVASAASWRNGAEDLMREAQIWGN